MGLFNTDVWESFTACLSFSYIPSYVHVRPGYREKLPDLQGTLKVHLRIYNKISSLHRPCNENWHVHYSLRACSMAINSVAGRIHLVISRRALAREGDYEMMPVCACVRACVRVCVR